MDPADRSLTQITEACEPEGAEVAAVSEPPRRNMWAALRHRQYRLFWTGNFLSNLGNWMQTLAQGWLVLQLTDSVFLLGLVGFMSSMPTLGVTLVGGVIADRSDRRRMLFIAQATMMAMAVVLAVLTWLNAVTVSQILVISLVAGIAAAMSAPAYQAIVPELVPPGDLTNAIAMNSAQFNLSRILGPTIAGFGLKYVGAAGCFFMNALSFLALLFVLTLLKLKPPSRAGIAGIWGPLRESFVYIHGQRSLAMLMMLLAVASLCAVPYATMMPAFARDVLHQGPEGLGYLMGSSGAGALAGAFLLARSGDRPRKGARLVNGFVLLYASLIVFCLLRSVILCAIALFFTGAAMVTAVSAVNNLLQKHVADEVRGRVMAMHATAFLGFAPIGSLIAGALAQSFGVPAALISLCAAALLFTLIVPLYMPEIKELA